MFKIKSKVTVKVTLSKFMVLLERPSHNEHVCHILNRGKCEFNRESITFLGNTLSKNEIDSEADKRKIDAIQDTARPTCT